MLCPCLQMGMAAGQLPPASIFPFIKLPIHPHPPGGSLMKCWLVSRRGQRILLVADHYSVLKAAMSLSQAWAEEGPELKG